MGLTIVQNDVQKKNMCGIRANMTILPILGSGEVRNWACTLMTGLLKMTMLLSYPWLPGGTEPRYIYRLQKVKVPCMTFCSPRLTICTERSVNPFDAE